MSAARARVLSGYRRLNRARAQLFKGDSHAMMVSHQQMRTEFERNKDAPTSGPEFETLVAGIDEAADMLTHEILRGDLNNDTGRYGTYGRVIRLIFGRVDPYLCTPCLQKISAVQLVNWAYVMS